MLETSVLDAEEHLLNQFLGRMLGANGFAAVVEVQARLSDRLERFLPLLGRKCGIDSLPEPTDVIGPGNTGSTKLLRLRTVKVADVDHNLRLSRNTASDGFNNVEQMVELEVVHRHEKDGVEVSLRRECLSLFPYLLDGESRFSEGRMPFTENAEATVAGTRGRFDSNLTEQHGLVAESPSRDTIGDRHEEPCFQGSLWKFQQIATVILRWPKPVQNSRQDPRKSFWQLHNLAPGDAQTYQDIGQSPIME
jgi:hypothetical protein